MLPSFLSQAKDALIHLPLVHLNSSVEQSPYSEKEEHIATMEL